METRLSREICMSNISQVVFDVRPNLVSKLLKGLSLCDTHRTSARFSVRLKLMELRNYELVCNVHIFVINVLFIELHNATWKNLAQHR